MILCVGKAVAVLALGTLCVNPAHADVLEIAANGDARWINGPQSLTVQTDPVLLTAITPDSADAAVGPLSEVPAEAGLVPDHAIAQVHRTAAQIPETYSAKVAELAHRFDLSPALIEALVWQESRWRSNAVSPVGARGLAQLMPGTARYLGVDPNDPFANLEGGARYLREQIDRFDGDLERALAAYNAGPGRVIRAGGIPRIRETQTYVSAIMGRLSAHSRSPE